MRKMPNFTTTIEYTPAKNNIISHAEQEFTLTGEIATSCYFAMLQTVGDSLIVHYNNNQEQLSDLRMKYAGGDVRADEF